MSEGAHTNRNERALPVTPDFFLIGAMKSGTTSLHAALARHPDVFLPDREVHLFAIDDVDEFPQATGWDGRAWTHQHFDEYFDEYAAWYASLYAAARPGQLLGEDSMTYLGSPRALDRLARHAPQARLIVLLRDPVARLVSHYWHWVRTYRAVYSLEDTLFFQHGNLLQRSCYEAQLRACFDRFPRSQVLVLLFEEFVADQERVLGDVLRFLGVEALLPASAAETHANPGRFPRFPGLALLRNQVLRRFFGRSYHGRLPRLDRRTPLSLPARLAYHAFRLATPDRRREPPPTRPETTAFLSRVLYERNVGLPALLGRDDLGAYWPTFRGEAARAGAVPLATQR